MQIVMWLLLAASIGAAAVVSHFRAGGVLPELGEVLSFGPIHLKLPADWAVTRPSEAGFEAILASEPAEQLGRQLVVSRVKLGRYLSPTQAATEMRLGDYGRAPEVDETRPTKIAGYTGATWAEQYEVGVPGSSAQRVKRICAVVVLPSRRAVKIELQGHGRPNGSDRKLVELIAQSLRFDDEPEAEEVSDAFDLGDGMTTSLKAPWRVVESKDPNRIGRTLLLDADLDEWMAVELLPCVAPPDKGSPPLIEALSVDPEPTSSVFIHDRSDGHVLVGMFHGTESSRLKFAGVWKQIVSKLEVAKPVDVASLRSAGAETMAALAARPLEDLVDLKPQSDRWWQWHREASNNYIGWSRWQIDHFGQWDGVYTSRWHESGDLVGELVQKWMSSAQRDQYQMHEESVIVGSSNRQLQNGRQAVTLGSGRMKIEIAGGGQPARGGQGEPPADYVPGALLPLLAGLFPDRPMLVRTDAVFGYEDLPHTGLLTVLIEPSTDHPRTADDGESPMRCLALRVNGSGAMSRWYFRPDRSLALVWLADGVYRTPSDAAAVGLAFGADERMRPGKN